MQSESKHRYTSDDDGDLLPSHRGGEVEEVAPICTGLESKDHHPREGARTNKMRRLHAAGWLSVPLLIYLIASWTQLGDRVQLFLFSEELLRRLASWHCQTSSPGSSVICPCSELSSSQTWLTEQHWPHSPSNRSHLALSNHWDGQTTS